MKLTKVKAIKHARKRVSQPVRFGDGWKFSVYDPERDIWVESQLMHRWKMDVVRSQALIDIARDAMDLPPVMYDRGPWGDYLPATNTNPSNSNP